MANKRFRALRLWHNTMLMVWGIPFLVLPGVIVGASTGRFWLFQVMMAACVLGLVIAIRRDRGTRCIYTLEGDRLGLVHGDERREIPLGEISDASLIDRAGARAYLREWGAKTGVQGKALVQREKEFTRYCTVDIGLTSFTFGLGRTLIDRLPNAKVDLVLLRKRDGVEFLLSPIHPQDLVESVSRRKMLV